MTQMTDTVPLPRALDLDNGDLEHCLVNSRLEIASILGRLHKHAVMLTAYIGASADADFILTSLLSVDAESGEVITEFGADAGANRRALSTSGVTFVATQDGIRIQFSAEALRKTRYQGRDAFIMRLPPSLLRLQRREFFRVATLNPPLQCVIPAQAELGIAPLSVDILDISCGGVKLGFPGQAGELETGVLLAACSLLLPEAVRVLANLHVRNLHRSGAKGGAQTWIGCEFADMAERERAPIQRYINLAERNRNRLR